MKKKSMITEVMEIPNWSPPKFYFVVNLGLNEKAISFQEVEGLDNLTQSPINKMIFKGGLISKDSSFFNWYSQISLNKEIKRAITIQLLDQNEQPKFTWKLNNAWPEKMRVSNLNPNNSQILIEELILIYESLTIEND